MSGHLCKICGIPFKDHKTCPGCGYTYCDCIVHCDHNLCSYPTPEKPKEGKGEEGKET